MTDPDPRDVGLREAFARLRASDARKLPPFDRKGAFPRVSPLRRAWPVAIPVLAAAAILVAVCSSPTPHETALLAPPSAPSGEPTLAVGTRGPNRLPLDFLLETSLTRPDDSMGFLARAPTFDPRSGKGHAR